MARNCRHHVGACSLGSGTRLGCLPVPAWSTGRSQGTVRLTLDGYFPGFLGRFIVAPSSKDQLFFRLPDRARRLTKPGFRGRLIYAQQLTVICQFFRRTPISPTVSVGENFPISSQTPCETPFPLDNWLSSQRLAGCLKGFDYLPGDLPSKVLLAGFEGGA